jgi:hypothetical protein
LTLSRTESSLITLPRPSFSYLDFAGWAVIKEKTAMNNNRSGRRYDREFKKNAVALVRGGRTITEVARDLGVSKWSLGHWVLLTVCAGDARSAHPFLPLLIRMFLLGKN